LHREQHEDRRPARHEWFIAATPELVSREPRIMSEFVSSVRARILGSFPERTHEYAHFWPAPCAVMVSKTFPLSAQSSRPIQLVAIPPSSQRPCRPLAPLLGSNTLISPGTGQCKSVKALSKPSATRRSSSWSAPPRRPDALSSARPNS